jgi:hypothetical protein
MSEKLYVTFGNERKYRITQSTLTQFLENSTIPFPLPEATSELLASFAQPDAIDPVQLTTVKTRLESIGFGEPAARTMASVLIQVAREQGVSPMEYFEVNDASLKLTRDAYQIINELRPSGNRIGLTAPLNNRRSRFSQQIQP